MVAGLALLGAHEYFPESFAVADLMVRYDVTVSTSWYWALRGAACSLLEDDIKNNEDGCLSSALLPPQ